MHFKRTLSLTLITLLLVGVFAACSQVAPTETPKGKYTAGSYVHETKGYGGTVAVTVEVDSEKILTVTAAGPQETKELGGKALTALPAQIIAAQSTEIAVVAGATVTSNALLKAVSSALLAAEGKEEPAVTVSMKAGTYTGAAKGYGGIIKATVTVSDTAITGVTLENTLNPDALVTESHPMFDMLCMTALDTEQIFYDVNKLLPNRILEAQSLGIDGISGATASSNAVLLATRDALNQAGADPKAFTAVPKKNTVEEIYTCDVVVVGGGTAGATAAAQATELGAKVVIVEKTARIGGTGAISAGPMSLNSTAQIKGGFTEDINAYYEEYDLLMHWSMKGNLFRTMLSQAGKNIDWLNEKGVLTVPDTSWFAETHGGPQRLAAYTSLPYRGMGVYNFYQSLVKDVDTLLMETTAKELIKDASGAITGVKATKYDGTPVTVNAKAVIVATGGFGGNDAMMEQQLGSVYKLLGMKQNDGSGLHMMLQAGANEFNASTVCSHAIGVPAIPGKFAAFERAIPHTLVTTAALLQVNSRGERFMNEEIQDADMTRGSVMHSAQGSYFYVLLSQDQVDTMATQGTAGIGQLYDPTAFSFENISLGKDAPLTNIQAVLDAAVSENLAYKGESVEAIAAALGADPAILANTLNTYNQDCTAGTDTQFGKKVSSLNALGNGPYYALKGTTVIYNTLGGVEVDMNAQVIDSKGKLISGLYAAGAESMGNIMDGTAYTNVSGINLAWAFNSGRIAAASAVNAIKK